MRRPSPLPPLLLLSLLLALVLPALALAAHPPIPLDKRDVEPHRLRVEDPQETLVVGASDAAAARRRYIVSFAPDANVMLVDDAISLILSRGGRITHRYSKVFLGFAVELPEVEGWGVEEMRALEGVESVEEDGIVSANV
ncbi:hypothetical protein DFJ74DRAFT_708054 [Hyaloraphidium curvatum]|nr:hypothetical protein DFJ74DRAFT_708054 [Hyaloraphidium curvatum]